MPLPFILGGLVLAAAGYGFKKSIDTSETADKVNEIVKEAEDLKEETKKRVESAESGYKNALMRLGEKKLHVISRGVSRFVEHFNQLKGHEFVINNMDMQNIQEQVSEALNVVNKCKEMGLSDLASLGGVGAAVGVLATYGAYTGISAAAGGTVLSSLGGTLAWMSGGAISLGGGLAAGSMALIGGVGVAPMIAILGVLSAKKMEKKLEEVEKAITEAYGVIDKLLAVERMVNLFTRQITKCDALLFSLSQDAIATIKKHNYDFSPYDKEENEEEKDQLCVTVSTLMTLSTFLKVPIIDKDQKLQEKVQRALEIMKGQMDSLESGRYNVAMIQSRQKDLENL
ncbi:glycine zipper family protein [Helicobacter pylori]|nr:glycine zipper family protein [Helicobacter pylori]